MPDLTTTAAAQASKIAYAMAGVKPKDVDVVEVYDAFTINTILFLEDLGFCKKGEGGDFVSNGNIAPGGSLLEELLHGLDIMFLGVFGGACRCYVLYSAGPHAVPPHCHLGFWAVNA